MATSSTQPHIPWYNLVMSLIKIGEVVAGQSIKDPGDVKLMQTVEMDVNAFLPMVLGLAGQNPDGSPAAVPYVAPAPTPAAKTIVVASV